MSVSGPKHLSRSPVPSGEETCWTCLVDTPNSAKLIALECEKMENGEKRKRRRFSDEYKAEMVRPIQSSGKSIGKMALEVGIGESALRH